jgi:hypothetical protein
MNPKEIAMSIRLFLACCLLAIAAASPAANDVSQGDLRVLFVGNSLTYFSDVPGIVAELGAKADPPVKIEVVRLVACATGLDGHLENGKVQPMIQNGGFTHVVLQPYNKLALEMGLLKTYVPMIDAIKARTVIYWPPVSGLEGVQERTPKHLAETRALSVSAVKEFNVLIAPSHEACLMAKTADPLLQLRCPARGKGNVHQGPLGSYVAALTIFTVITGRSPLGIPLFRIKADKFTPVETTITPEQARWLQALVLRTLRDHPGIGRGWTAPALPADLPDLSKPYNPSLTPEQRQAALLAYYWQIYEAMLKPPPGVKTEFNAGILLNIIETFPGTPDAAKAKQLIEDRTKK